MAAQCCCCKGPGAEAAPARPPPEPPPALDVASASSAQLFRLRHLQLGLELRPEARELAGCLVLELCALRPAPRALVLDAHPALRLHSAAFRRAPAAATEPPCAFAFAAAEPGPAPPPPLPAFPDAPGAEPACCPLAFRVDPFTDYGSSLTVTLPPELQAHQPFQVILRYTSTDAPAIWWLDPELTYGNAKPFVFTQGHSVCNRSFFPCFDTPAVKCTYSAVVKAPSGVQVLMSATQSTYVEEEGVYRFHMEHPVPAYLVALVAGDLQPADIGPRSRVWAEPCLLPTATSKLSGAVEQWLSAAERLYGPYMWGRYDIVFLPPSFPIVAMENPCLTFIISSILESDEFLVIDVIHEVAHSWFGNAVTNATWEEMWLSEGLATYAQRRITTETYGAAFTCLETAFRLDALHRQMKLLGEDSPVSKLQVKLEPGVNPSHLMNLFTYEKGYCFVYYLSQLCGEPQRFDDFLRAYVEKYKFTSVVAQDLLDSFLSFFPELKEQSVDCRAGRYLPCRAGVRALAQRHGPTAGRARPVSGIQPDPAGRGPLPAVDCGASGPGSCLSQCHRHLQVEDLPDSALPGPAPRWVPAAPGGGDEPVQVLLLPAGLDERRDPDPLAADRGPQRLLPRPPPGPAVPREPDVPHVHHPAVRGPLHRRTQVLRPGGVLPDTGPTAPQPAQDHPADPVPGPGPRRRAWRGAGQGRGGLGGGRRHAGPAARGRGPQQHHFSQGRQRVCLALTSQTPRLCLRGPGLP